MSTIERDARAVLLPAIADLRVTDTLRRFLDDGGRSLLLGETREEYVARRMSDVRRSTETADQFHELTEDVARRAGPSLVAVDQEPGGIERLHGLVPGLPDAATLRSMSSEEIEVRAQAMGEGALGLGVTMLLSPIVDVVTGPNSWLAHRTLGPDLDQVGRIGAAYVRGVQRAGLLATAKHFPGHFEITGDPAIEVAEVPDDRAALEEGLSPFRAAIAAGIGAVMTGPALVLAMDASQPSSLSRVTIATLRRTLGFTGLVVSDDIDSPATLRGLSVPEAAVAALHAGTDLLLLAADGHLADVSEAIVAAVRSGSLDVTRLSEAARNVERAAEARRPSERNQARAR